MSHVIETRRSSKESIWMIFDFRDFREFKRWIVSNFFDSYWQEYQRDYLNVVDRDKVREKQLRIVIARIIENEKSKQKKFSIKKFQKTSWNNVDYKALLVHDVKKKNCAIFELFYEKVLSKFEIENTIWNIIEYVMIEFASSRKNRKFVKVVKVIKETIFSSIETNDQHMTLRFEVVVFFFDSVELFVEDMIRMTTRNYVVAQQIIENEVDIKVMKKSLRESLNLSLNDSNDSNDSNDFDSNSSSSKKEIQSSQSQFDNQWNLREFFRSFSSDSLTESRFSRQSISASSIIAFDDDQLVLTTKRFHDFVFEFWDNQFDIRRNQIFSFEKQSLTNAQRMMRDNASVNRKHSILTSVSESVE